MHPQAYSYIERVVSSLLLAGAHIVELGAYDVNSTLQGLNLRALCTGSASYIGIDSRSGPGVDLVLAAQAIASDSLPQPADIVICAEVLEHDPDPAGIIAAADRILKPGGTLILTAAGPGRTPHGCNGGLVGDEHYRNISTDELSGWLATWSWSAIEENAVARDIYAMAVKATPKKSTKTKSE